MGHNSSATEAVSSIPSSPSTPGSPAGRSRRKPAVPITVKVKGLRRKKGKWYFRLKRHGVSNDRCTGLKDTEENIPAALAMRAAALEELKSGGTVARQRQQADLSFRVAASEFLTAYDLKHREKPNTGKRMRTSFATLLYFFGTQSLGALTPSAIERFMTWRRQNHIAEVTIRHDIHALSSFFQYARKMGWIAGDPLTDIEVPSDKDATRINVLSPDMERRYLHAAREVSLDLFDVSVIMIQQGCRPEEVMTLEQWRIDLVKGEFSLKNATNAKGYRVGKSVSASRVLKMTPDVKKIFKRRLETPGRWVFPSRRLRGSHITRLNKTHDRIVDLSGVSCTIYDFRHTFATRLATDPVNPCPLPILAALLGHSSLSCVMKYVHPNQRHMDEAMEKYGQALSPERDLAAVVGSGPGATLGPLSGSNRATLELIWTNPKRKQPAREGKVKTLEGKEVSR